MDKEKTLTLLDRLEHFTSLQARESGLQWSLVSLIPGQDGHLEAHLRCDFPQIESVLVVGDSGQAWLKAVDRLDLECGGLLG